MTPQKQRQHDHRRGREPGRMMQTSAAWRKASAAFLREPGNETCAYCRAAPATCVDHRRAHKGDYGLFWSRANWAPACMSCNRAKAIALEGTFGRKPGAFKPPRPRGCDAVGNPLDPLHPWNWGR